MADRQRPFQRAGLRGHERHQAVAHRLFARIGGGVCAQLRQELARDAGGTAATFACVSPFSGHGHRDRPLTALLALAPPVPGGGGLAVLRPCAAAQLKAAVASDEHAMLHRELRITLTNASAQACAMDGFPAVRLIDELKHVRISAESYSREPHLFILSPGQQAAFGLRIATGDGTTST